MTMRYQSCLAVYLLVTNDLCMRKLWGAASAGLMYLRLPLDTATAGYNRSAALWISMFAFTLMPSETACSVWNQERAVVCALPIFYFKIRNERQKEFFPFRVPPACTLAYLLCSAREEC